MLRKPPVAQPIRLALAILAFTTLTVSGAKADVFVEVFESYVDTGSSVTFSNPVGSFSSPSVDFFVGTGGSWHPFGLSSFGARITGNLYLMAVQTSALAWGPAMGAICF